MLRNLGRVWAEVTDAVEEGDRTISDALQGYQAECDDAKDIDECIRVRMFCEEVLLYSRIKHSSCNAQCSGFFFPAIAGALTHQVPVRVRAVDVRQGVIP